MNRFSYNFVVVRSQERVHLTEFGGYILRVAGWGEDKLSPSVAAVILCFLPCVTLRGPAMNYKVGLVIVW